MEVEYLADHREFIPVIADWHQREQPRLKTRIDRLAFCCGRCEIPTAVVALKNGALLGSGMLVVHDMEGHMELCPWLAGVFVLPDYRREGVGTAVVGRLVDEARTLGVDKLHLYTPHSESFYERLGWSVVKRAFDYRGVDVTVMSYQL